MTFSLLLILITKVFLFTKVRSSYCAVDEIQPPESCKREQLSPDYDLMILAQTWPQTACWVINDKWQYQNCTPCNYVPKSSSSWTVHGLWPSNRDGNHPFYCDPSKKFDAKLLGGSLTAKLNGQWATFDLQSDNLEFWKHEWDKHGTCASDVQSVDSVPKYFSKTLELLDTYNIGYLLKMSGIVPGTQYLYEIEDIVRAIEAPLGVRVSVSCAVNTINRTNYLDQIYICFDKSLRLIDCDVTTTIDCNNGTQVIYPEILIPCKENSFNVPTTLNV